MKKIYDEPSMLFNAYVIDKNISVSGGGDDLFADNTEITPDD